MSLRTFIRGIFRRETESQEPSLSTRGSSGDGGPSGLGCSDRPGRIPVRMMDGSAAGKEVERYRPLIDELNEKKVPYAVVGGFGVMLQGLDKGAERVRATEDIDLMVGDDVDDELIIELYIQAYSISGKDADELRSSIYGGAAGDSGESSYDYGYDDGNTSIVGVDDGETETPNLDIVRKLNGFSLKDISSEKVPCGGVFATVATVGQLREMKKRTIELLHATIDQTSRPQDIIDLMSLDKLPKLPAREEACSRSQPVADQLSHIEEVSDVAAERSFEVSLRNAPRKGIDR